VSGAAAVAVSRMLQVLGLSGVDVWIPAKAKRYGRVPQSLRVRGAVCRGSCMSQCLRPDQVCLAGRLLFCIASRTLVYLDVVPCLGGLSSSRRICAKFHSRALAVCRCPGARRRCMTQPSCSEPLYVALPGFGDPVSSQFLGWWLYLAVGGRVAAVCSSCRRGGSVSKKPVNL